MRYRRVLTIVWYTAGSAQIYFDATGFSNTCPHGRDTAGEIEAIIQDETTSVCRHRTAADTCRFVDGVFCGICAIGEAEQRHRLYLLETAVLRVEPPAVSPHESSTASMREVEIQCLDVALEACPCGLLMVHIERTDGTTHAIREGQDYDGIVGLQPADVATASDVGAIKLQVHGSTTLRELLLQVTPTSVEVHWLSTRSTTIPHNVAKVYSRWIIGGAISIALCAAAGVCFKARSKETNSRQRQHQSNTVTGRGENVGGLGPWHDDNHP
jgi:hypothetical protein